MELTREQHEAVEKGERVRVEIDGLDCAVVRWDIFETAQRILGHADDDDPRATYPAILRAWDADDRPGDYDVYRDDA
ncbi:MAG: hypothetical protein WD066_00100 [Planctomycetaceae bacterium]